MGNKQAAIQTLQTYSKATHHKDTAAYMIAQVFYGDNNLDSASSYLNYCISKNPSYFNAFYLLGNINFEQEKYNDAISNYTKVINISTTSADAYNDRAALNVCWKNTMKPLKIIIWLLLSRKMFFL